MDSNSEDLSEDLDANLSEKIGSLSTRFPPYP